jgi:hypothetical protein
MAMDVGGLFKLLNSNICDGFYPHMTPGNKQEIIDKMMNDEVFMSMAHQYVTDDNVIRNKIDTNMGQLLKKKTRLVTPHEIFLANLDGISSQLDKGGNRNEVEESKIVVAPAVTKEISVVQVVDEIAEFDEEKGKHIGSGIYLKREGHLIKMTTPNFTVHY